MKKHNLLLYYSFFITYIAWGSFWLGLSFYTIAEEAVSAQWILLFTGFPSSLIATVVPVGVLPKLILLITLGAIQWTGLVYLLVTWKNSKTKP